MVERYRGGVVPADPRGWDTPLERASLETLGAYARAMDAIGLQEGAAQVIELASRANRYVEETAPWKLSKEKKDAELDSVLANLVRAVARLDPSSRARPRSFGLPWARPDHLTGSRSPTSQPCRSPDSGSRSPHPYSPSQTQVSRAA